MTITDTTIMFFGIHFGKPLKDVPDAYLRWLHSSKGRKYCPPVLFPYIKQRIDLADYRSTFATTKRLPLEEETAQLQVTSRPKQITT